jgi:hypothetical protein
MLNRAVSQVDTRVLCVLADILILWIGIATICMIPISSFGTVDTMVIDSHSANSASDKLKFLTTAIFFHHTACSCRWHLKCSEPY